MTVILLLFVVLSLIGIQLKTSGGFYEDYMSAAKSLSIKGIFVILVFFRHFLQYVHVNGPLDQFVRFLNSNMGQLLVAMFLCYSGYGLMVGIQKKAFPAVLTLPKRTAKLLIHFDIVILLFVVLDLCLGYHLTWQKVLLSLVGWSSVGNSNWYIFAVLILYILMFVAFLVWKGKKPVVSAVILTLLCIGYILVMRNFKRSFWYNTILCFPLGVWYGIFKEKLDRFFMKNGYVYMFSLLVFAVAFFLCFMKHRSNIWIYEGWALSFTMLVLLITMKVQIDNRFLRFLGSHVFSIYILQRLPMRFLDRITDMNRHPYIYFVLSFLCTVCLAMLFDYWVGKLDKKIFPARKG